MKQVSRPERERLLMDRGWRFHLGDFPQPTAHAGWMKSGNFNFPPLSRNFDDREWRKIDLPHDFVVEGDFVRSIEESTGQHNVAGLVENQSLYASHGSRPPAVGWYRKRFDLTEADRSRRLCIEFDGIARNAKIWLNHHFLGCHTSGYTGFRFDITDIAEEINTLVIRADTTEYEGWFYEGGGIYRHVWLVKHDHVHFAHDGVFVHAKVLSTNTAKVTVDTELCNETDDAFVGCISLTAESHDGRVVARCVSDAFIPAGGSSLFSSRLEVDKPALWSVDSPHMYTLHAELLTTRSSQIGRKSENAKLQQIDNLSISFGIRSFRFDPDNGFFLNEQPLKLKGVCCHQDHAGVGVALPDRIQEFRIRTLKEMGCNAYRCSHNPPTSELLDTCDRLGMLVIDETRLLGSTPGVLGELEDMVKRDRNHPSVILWSIGNEEHLQGKDSGARMATSMRRLVRSLDPTRPITLAMNGAWGEGASHVVDVQGCNYIKAGNVDEFHKKFPDKPILYTESASTVGTRGVYAKDADKGYVPSYDMTDTLIGWGDTAEENWLHCLERPFISGTFIWTGFDYRGEPTPYAWPCINSHFGILDTCGFPKDNFYYYQSWWSEQDVLHILPHWNWPGREGELIDVWVHSNCDAVELFLNGCSQGCKNVSRGRHLEWKVSYNPGTLLAIGYRKGRSPQEVRVETTGSASAIRLVPDRVKLNSDNEDTALVRVEIIDELGRIVPIADNAVDFTLSSNGRILGVGNGNPSSHDPDKAALRRAFNGLCQVIVQAGDGRKSVVLKAASVGLKSACLTIRTVPSTMRPHVPDLSEAFLPTIQCSALHPAMSDIQSVKAPDAEMIFTTITPGQDGFCEIRNRHGGKHGVCYIRSDVFAPRAGISTLHYGADGPVKVWVNGKVVDCQPCATNPAVDGQYVVKAAWRKGMNTILFALNTNQGKAWGVFCRPQFRT